MKMIGVSFIHQQFLPGFNKHQVRIQGEWIKRGDGGWLEKIKPSQTFLKMLSVGLNECSFKKKFQISHLD